MEYTVGSVVEGKVKSLTKFGAFVTLPDGVTGMVHISEIAYTYVSDIHDHLKEGDVVKVMVISAENGKINLSIKRTLPPPQKPQQPRQNFSRPSAPRQNYDRPRQDAAAASQAQPAQPQQKSFDDMLKAFMTESDSKISSVKQYSDHKTKTRRR